MNKNLVRYVLGFVLIILAIMLLLPVIVAFIYRENDWKYFLLLSGACGLVGGISSQFKPKKSQMLVKEGCPLTFKGGTSLLLILGGEARRLSIDIDVLCPPGTDIEQYLQNCDK